MRVCFVCTGNICRSPMAEMVLRQLALATPVRHGVLADHLEVSSAGTGPWHVGEPMDPRARRALADRGYVDGGHVARQFQTDWLNRLDLVVALDRRHFETLRSLGGRRDDQLAILRSFDGQAGGELDVPDPYYGEGPDFVHCLAMVERACVGLATELCARVPS
jgi:protein-tyrosine phosphatase